MLLSAVNDNTTIDDEYDVIIVGARAAGASTAMLLARAGLRVLAIDRSAPGTDTVSTHSLAPAGVLQLSRWGVLDRIRDAGTPVANRVVFHYGADTVDLGVPPRGDVDGLYSPRRTVLDSVLVAEAVASGATVRHHTSLQRLCRDHSGRVCGVELKSGNQLRTVSARWVVGADGGRSQVAQSVDAAELRREQSAGATIYSYWSGLPTDVIENHHEAGHAAGTIPTNDGLSVVWVGFPQADFDAVAKGRRGAAFDEFVAATPRLAAQLQGAERVGGFHGFRGARGHLRQAWGSGWALVGDAGYFKDPISAHGITDAFIGAELLADALVATHHQPHYETDALRGYQRQRDELAGEMMPAVARACRFDGDLPAVKSAFRDMSEALRREWELLVDRDRLTAAA